MAVDFANFQQVFHWVIAHGYILICLVMCVEGPMITAAAGFAAALGYFNPWIILFLSIAGDLVPDSIYYTIGYFSRFPIVEKISHKFGLTEVRILKTEKLLKNNFKKTMVMLKLTPVAATPGFILVGYLRLPFYGFLALCAAVTFPKSVIFLLIGYFFGRLYNIDQYIHYAGILLPAIIFLGALFYFGYKKIILIIAKKVEKT